MNYTLFVCMSNDNIQRFSSEQIQFKKFMFSLGLDDISCCYINDLLGVDYNNFGQGLKIFLEDDGHKASDILISLNKLQKFNENIYYNFQDNVIVIRYFKTKTNEVNDFINDTLKLNFSSKILKVFGVSKQKLNKYLNSVKHKNNFFDFSIYEKYLDSAIIIRFYKNVTTDIQENLIQQMIKDLEKFYYADRDITLSNAVFEILTIQHMKISIAESFTAGLVTNTLIRENAGASAIIKESYIVYSDDIKHKILNVENKTLKNFTAVSAETAFEMAIGLLNLTDADIVIATTGYANHKDSELDGLFFTAIGDSKAVNVYKHKYSDSRENTIYYGVNVALYETIRKLRQNALKNIDFVV